MLDFGSKADELLDNFRRSVVFNGIVYNPGCRQCDLKKHTNLQPQAMIHHIHVLEKAGLIVSYEGNDGYSHYRERVRHEMIQREERKKLLEEGQEKPFMSPPAYADRQQAAEAAA